MCLSVDSPPKLAWDISFEFTGPAMVVNSSTHSFNKYHDWEGVLLDHSCRRCMGNDFYVIRKEKSPNSQLWSLARLEGNWLGWVKSAMRHFPAMRLSVQLYTKNEGLIFLPVRNCLSYIKACIKLYDFMEQLLVWKFSNVLSLFI